MTDRQPLDYSMPCCICGEFHAGSCNWTRRDTKSDDTALLALAVGSVLLILIALGAGVALGAWVF